MTRKIIYLVFYRVGEQRKICAAYSTLDQAVRYCNLRFVGYRGYNCRIGRQRIDSMIISPVELNSWFSPRALPTANEISFSLPELDCPRWSGNCAEIYNHRLSLLERKENNEE